MTEQQIEALAERRMDALDRAYLSTGMTEAEYQSEARGIDLEYNRLMQSLERCVGQ